MEWVVKNVNDAEREIAEGNYDRLRHFTVGKRVAYSPAEDITGGEWQVCSSHTVGDFSAVAYFFGRKLMAELDVPIGLINTSWGGTNIETWISWDVMKHDEAHKNVNLKALEKSAAANEERVKKYHEAIKTDKGLTEKWYASDYVPTGWKTMDLPEPWHNTELAEDDGIVWFRREITLPKGVENHEATLGLGPIDDRDDAYVNGLPVGSTNSYVEDRQYSLKTGTLKEGKNIIAVRVTDTGGGGGFHGKETQLFLEVAGSRHPLHGEWSYKPSVRTTDFGIRETGPNSFPSQLFNTMIAPIVKFKIRGVIWYQGESNVGDPKKYQQLFPALIHDWREKWGYDFPFLWVQLANFLKPSDVPQESNWAALREAQTMTLKVPATGQALAIDIGDAGDIHPRNKQDVGLRLALAALKVAYEKDVVYSGPMVRSVERDGTSLKISFDHIGAGLQARGDKYGYLRGFAVAGPDGKFVWAKASIEGDKIVVWSDEISKPVAVRFAWKNFMHPNLYNGAGLPASPFRTDDWQGETFGKN